MNYQSMGLPEAHGQNAFTACVPRSTNIADYIAPPKRGPKPSPNQRSVISLMSPEERKEALIAFKKINLTISPNPQADSDNTARISGRANGRRTQ